MGLYKMASFRTENPINVSYESSCPFISLGVAYHSCPLEAHGISGDVVCR